MNPFSLTILNIYDKNPSFRSLEIAKKIGVPDESIKRVRQNLIDKGFLEKHRNSEYYVTFLGEIQLAQFDLDKSKASVKEIKNFIKTISKTLEVEMTDVKNVVLLDSGMTNNSYSFEAKGKKYIYRAAGEGSDVLVDRYREHNNYKVLKGKDISDEVLYHNPKTGVKISRFIEDSMPIDKENQNHLNKAIKAIKNLHSSNIEIPHIYNFKERIEYYQKLCIDADVDFLEHYEEYKESILKLLEVVDSYKIDYKFCHIDFVPSNCLLHSDKVTLIDWEYSGGQDPVVDIAMFCVSADFTKPQSDKLLEKYFGRKPSRQEYIRFYTYIATAGLMWSLWSEYKTNLGDVFEGYTLRVYKLCQKYIQLANKLINES